MRLAAVVCVVAVAAGVTIAGVVLSQKISVTVSNPAPAVASPAPAAKGPVSPCGPSAKFRPHPRQSLPPRLSARHPRRPRSQLRLPPRPPVSLPHLRRRKPPALRSSPRK